MKNRRDLEIKEICLFKSSFILTILIRKNNGKKIRLPTKIILKNNPNLLINMKFDIKYIGNPSNNNKVRNIKKYNVFCLPKKTAVVF